MLFLLGEKWKTAFDYVKLRRKIASPNTAFTCNLIEIGDLLHGGAENATLLFRCAYHAPFDPCTAVLKLCRNLQTRRILVPATSLLCPKGVYVIRAVRDGNNYLFLWIGKATSLNTLHATERLANLMNGVFSLTNMIVKIYQGAETEDFLSFLLKDGPYSDESEHIVKFDDFFDFPPTDEEIEAAKLACTIEVPQDMQSATNINIRKNNEDSRSGGVNRDASHQNLKGLEHVEGIADRLGFSLSGSAMTPGGRKRKDSDSLGPSIAATLSRTNSFTSEHGADRGLLTGEGIISRINTIISSAAPSRNPSAKLLGLSIENISKVESVNLNSSGASNRDAKDKDSDKSSDLDSSSHSSNKPGLSNGVKHSAPQVGHEPLTPVEEVSLSAPPVNSESTRYIPAVELSTIDGSPAQHSEAGVALNSKLTSPVKEKDAATSVVTTDLNLLPPRAQKSPSSRPGSSEHTARPANVIKIETPRSARPVTPVTDKASNSVPKLPLNLSRPSSAVDKNAVSSRKPVVANAALNLSSLTNLTVASQSHLHAIEVAKHRHDDPPSPKPAAAPTKIDGTPRTAEATASISSPTEHAEHSITSLFLGKSSSRNKIVPISGLEIINAVNSSRPNSSERKLFRNPSRVAPLGDLPTSSDGQSFNGIAMSGQDSGVNTRRTHDSADNTSRKSPHGAAVNSPQQQQPSSSNYNDDKPLNSSPNKPMRKKSFVKPTLFQAKYESNGSYDWYAMGLYDNDDLEEGEVFLLLCPNNEHHIWIGGDSQLAHSLTDKNESAVANLVLQWTKKISLGEVSEILSDLDLTKSNLSIQLSGKESDEFWDSFNSGC